MPVLFLGILVICMIITCILLYPFARVTRPTGVKYTLQADPTSKPVVDFKMIHPILQFANYKCEKQHEHIYHLPGKLNILEIGSYNGADIVDIVNGIGADRINKWIAVEPTYSKIKTIRRNTDNFRNSLNLEILHAAVSNFTGTVDIFIDCEDKEKDRKMRKMIKNGASDEDIRNYKLENCGSQQDTIGKPPVWDEQYANHAIQIKSYKLDDLVPVGERIDYIKIDTQGHELQILQGGRRFFLENPPPVMLIEFSPNLATVNFDASAPLQILNMIHSYGYICFSCSPIVKMEDTAPGTHLFENFPKQFGSYMFRGANHGAWVDLLCFHY